MKKVQKKVQFTSKEINKFINEELQKLVEAASSDDQGKKSHEISAAADTLSDAITTFEEADLPEVPEELSSSLRRAKNILNNMSDNPGQYKGAQGKQRSDDKLEL